MDHEEIYKMARTNNIGGLLRAKKEVRQLYSARSVTETLCLNDMTEIEIVISQAEQKIDGMLEDVKENMRARRKALFLLGRDYAHYEDNLKNNSMVWNGPGWEEMMRYAFNERYYQVKTMEIGELYDRARMHRIRTIILENGMESLFGQMGLEAKKIRLDTANIKFLSEMLFGLEEGKSEMLEPVRKMMTECLKNRLWVNEGAINQCYFEKVWQINIVINKYFEGRK